MIRIVVRNQKLPTACPSPPLSSYRLIARKKIVYQINEMGPLLISAVCPQYQQSIEHFVADLVPNRPNILDSCRCGRRGGGLS